MATPVEDTFLLTNCPDWELLPDLNENQADGSSVDNKIVPFSDRKFPYSVVYPNLIRLAFKGLHLPHAHQIGNNNLF